MFVFHCVDIHYSSPIFIFRPQFNAGMEELTEVYCIMFLNE